MAMTPPPPPPCARRGWCSRLHAVLACVLLLWASHLAEPVDAALGIGVRLVGYSPSYELRAEDFWSDPPVFEVWLTGQTDEAFEAAPITADKAAYIAQTVESNSSVPNGIAAHVASIFTDVVRVNGTLLRYTVTATSLLDFTHPLHADRLRFKFDSAKLENVTSGTTASAFRTVKGLTTNGAASFADTESGARALTELAVRRDGVAIRVDLQFNDFPAATNDSVVITSNDAVLTAARDQWAVSLPSGMSTFPTPSLVFTLPAQPTFNISEGAWIHIRLNATRLRIALPVAPNAANLTIASIDGMPLAFCNVANNTITEAELRSVGGAGVLRTVTLSPPTSDAFVTGNVTLLAPTILSSVSASADLRILVSAVTAGSITLNISALAGSTYDTDVAFPLSIVMDPELLVSKEAGCGQTFISVVPSPGTVTSVINASLLARTELDINDEVLDLDFVVAFDRFVTGSTLTYDAVATLSPSTATDGGAEYFGYEQTIGGRATVSLIGTTRTRIRIQFPRTERYNIPFGSTETIAISFPASAVVSGVAPVMSGATFNVTGVAPTFNVSFDGDITQGTVTALQLWDRGANMSLNLRGDTWDVNGRNLWNINHPRLEGSIRRGDELYSMQQTIDRVGGLANVVDYANVNITLRSASLPLFPLPGLSVRTDERVRVSKLSQLILGRPTVAQENFDVVQIRPADLRISFAGVATPGRVVGEKDFRSGFWFTMTLNYNVFKVNSTDWFADLYPQTSSLTPFLSHCQATRDPAWVYNFSCPALPTFDIDIDELIPVVAPGAFYYEVLPVQEGTATIGVIAAPAPTCVWNADISFTEGDIRNVAGGGFFIEVRSTEPFDADADQQNMTVGTIVRSTHQASHPINITVRPRFLPLFLQLVVQPDPAYEINTNDVVTVHLDRFFFDIRERCNPLNFTIKVLPGTGFGTNTSTDAAAAEIRDGDVQFTMTLLGERVVGPEFDFLVSIQYLPGAVDAAAGATAPTTGKTVGVAEGLATFGFQDAISVLAPAATLPGGATAPERSNYVIRARAVSNWTDPSLNATVFAATLPRIPNYRILQPENITVAIPGSAVASGVQPILTESSFVFRPSPSRVNFTFNTTIEERFVTRGTVPPLRIQLLDDYWNTTTTPNLFREQMRRTGSGATALSDLATGSMLAIFNLAAFSFPSPDVMLVTMSPDSSYDAPADEDFVLAFSKEMVVSQVQPAVSNITLRIVAGTPLLIPSGSALRAGSRAFIQGGLSLELYLENDLFLRNVLLPDDVCPFGKCAISIDNDGRTLSVNFQATPATVLTANATFVVFIKPAAVRSNATALNNVSLEIALEPGIATLSFTDSPTTVSEDTVAKGQLPSLLLNVIGDRFVNDRTRLASALAAGTVCFPKSDSFGFCGRAESFFTTIDVRFFSLQTVTLTLQADESFDVANNELVNISIGATGLESGLAPTGWVSLIVTPVRGSYYFSTTAKSVPSATLVSSDAIDVTVTLSLRNERFQPYPTSAVIAGTRTILAASDEPNGYDRYKTAMYHEGVLSADQRTLVLKLKRTPGYAAQTDETISFVIPADAVLSPNAPTLASEGAAAVVIERSGGSLTLQSPSVTTAARVRAYGINITVTSTDRWQAVYISGLGPAVIQEAIASSKPPAVEPFGFEALKSQMLSRTIIVESNQLDLAVAPAPTYALENDEVISFAFTNPRWGSTNRRMVPDRIDILVKAKASDTAGNIVLYVAVPVDEGSLQRAVAEFTGITTDRVVIKSNEYFVSTFRRVEVDILPAPIGAPSTAKAPNEVADLLVVSNQDLVRRRMNVSAIEKSAAPLDSDTLLLRLGIRVDRTIEREEQSLVWLWVSIAAMAFAAVAAAAFYHFRLKGRMIAPTASDARSAPLLKVKGAGGTLDAYDDGDGGERYESGAPIKLGDAANGMGFDDEWAATERGARLSPSPPGRSASPPATADAALDQLLATSAGRATYSSPVNASGLVPASAAAAATGRSTVSGRPTNGGTAARAAPFTDDDAHVAGPTLAGRKARDVRIDLDEFVHSRQPGAFLRPETAPLEFGPLERLPPNETPVGIYNPGTPARQKFRTKTVDTRFI